MNDALRILVAQHSLECSGIILRDLLLCREEALVPLLILDLSSRVMKSHWLGRGRVCVRLAEKYNDETCGRQT